MKPIKIALIGAGGLGVSTTLHICECWEELSKKTTLPKIELSIFDDDIIELSNLNRQILFSENDISHSKSKKLCACLSKKFKNIKFNEFKTKINKENITQYLKNSSLIIDSTDSPTTKFLINDFCIKNKISFSFAGVLGLVGQSLLINPEDKDVGCLRCLFGDLSDEEISNINSSCQSAGILGVVAAKTSLLQANDILEYLVNDKSEFKLKIFDFNKFQIKTFPSQKDKNCSLCSKREKIKTLDLTKKECPQTFILSKLGAETYPKGLIARFSDYSFLNKTSDSLDKEKIHNLILRGCYSTWDLLIVGEKSA